MIVCRMEFMTFCRNFLLTTSPAVFAHIRIKIFLMSWHEQTIIFTSDTYSIRVLSNHVHPRVQKPSNKLFFRGVSSQTRAQRTTNESGTVSVNFREDVIAR